MKLFSNVLAAAMPSVTLCVCFIATPTPAQSSTSPDWQIAAGGKMAFDVASVKRNMADPSSSASRSNISLGPFDFFTPTGGLLSSANWPLIQYLFFAYKLTPNQWQAVISQLPKWANTDRYDIEARAPGNPTKDQFRLMMQALLAERFNLAVHYETRQLPVMALVLDRPGKLGPQLQQHPEGSTCSTMTPAPGAAQTISGGFPEICGGVAALQPSVPGRVRAGARNMYMTAIVNSFPFVPEVIGVDRPVVDKTGLIGKFDFVIEFTSQPSGPAPPDATVQPDSTGPTFLEALKEQLGLKLESQIGPVDVLVIDHVEEPSAN